MAKDGVLVALCVGYAVFNSFRKTLPIALPLLLDDLGLNKSEIGLVSSSFAFAYGCSKFGGSIVSDYVDCKMLFCVGLLCASWTSLLFPCVGSSVYLLSGVWFLNGLVQGVGWPSVSKVIFLTYPPEKRGTAWSTASAAGNFGLLMGSILFPSLLRYGWKMPFYFSGTLGFVLSFCCFAAFRFSSNASADSVIKRKDAVGSVSFWSCFRSIPLCSLFLASACNFFTVRGISDWAVLYFTEACMWDPLDGNYALFIFEVGSICGSVMAGYCSDLMIVGKRKDIVCWLISLVLLVSIGLLLWGSPLDLEGSIASSLCLHHISYNVGMFFLGFGTNGPKSLIGLLVRESVPLEYFGIAGGILGLVGQVGSALAGHSLGTLLQSFGWNIFFPILFYVSSIFSASMFAFIFFKDKEESINGNKSKYE